MNPELVRNAWLELSVQRLVILPLVLAAVFWLAHQGAGAEGVAVAAWWAYLGLALLLGTRAAGAAVSDEVVARTWDWQRLSSLDAWTLTWGKLAGAPLFAWYGAGLALLALASALLVAGTAPPLVAVRVALLLLAALAAHATALALSLLAVRKRDSLSGGGRLWPLLGGLLLAGPFLALEQDVARGELAPVAWYDRLWLPLDFGLASALLFAGLAWLAACRLMRAELQMRNRPWVWLLCLMIVAAWLAGFVGSARLPWNPDVLDWWGPTLHLLGDTSSLRLLAVMIFALAAAYAAGLLEAKSPVVLRRLLRASADGDVDLALSLLPRWCYALLLAVGAGVAALALQSSSAPTARSGFASAALVLAPLAFAARDLGLLLFLHLAPSPRRADGAWLVYLAVLWVLLPMVAAAAGAGAATAWLLPRPDLGAGALLPPLLEAAAVLVAVVLRWRRRAPL